MTYYLNPEAFIYEVANNAAKGAIHGGLNALIISPLGYLGGSSVPAQTAVSLLSLQYDLLGGAISNQYDIINKPPTIKNKSNN